MHRRRRGQIDRGDRCAVLHPGTLAAIPTNPNCHLFPFPQPFPPRLPHVALFPVHARACSPPCPSSPLPFHSLHLFTIVHSTVHLISPALGSQAPPRITCSALLARLTPPACRASRRGLPPHLAATHSCMPTKLPFQGLRMRYAYPLRRWMLPDHDAAARVHFACCLQRLAMACVPVLQSSPAWHASAPALQPSGGRCTARSDRLPHWLTIRARQVLQLVRGGQIMELGAGALRATGFSSTTQPLRGPALQATPAACSPFRDRPSPLTSN